MSSIKAIILYHSILLMTKSYAQFLFISIQSLIAEDEVVVLPIFEWNWNKWGSSFDIYWFSSDLHSLEHIFHLVVHLYGHSAQRFWKCCTNLCAERRSSHRVSFPQTESRLLCLLQCPLTMPFTDAHLLKNLHHALEEEEVWSMESIFCAPLVLHRKLHYLWVILFSPHSCYWDLSNTALLVPMLLLETIQWASSCLYVVFIWICDYFFIENQSNFIKNVMQPRAAIMKMASCECSSCLQYRIIDEILDTNLSANRNRDIALEILDCQKSTLLKHRYWTWTKSKKQ